MKNFFAKKWFGDFFLNDNFENKVLPNQIVCLVCICVKIPFYSKWEYDCDGKGQFIKWGDCV